mmetsp:Transcript_37355/g.87647  ORF Transcript_37355/g.87647 Transcript_37355/m.87647 type:complete len:604 (+) Transcript_37355:2-1813(+)
MEISASVLEDAATHLKRDGFAIVRGCLDAAWLRRLVDEYEARVVPFKHSFEIRRERHGAEGEDGLARVVHISNMHELPGLAHLAADWRLLKVASACLANKGVRPIINIELFDKPPLGNSSTATPPHQDNFYFKASEPGIALWIALDDMDDSSGTLRYVLGSHLAGLRAHEWDWGPAGFAKNIYDYSDADDDMERSAGHLDPGDVVVHHGLTIHHASANLTAKRRRAVTINYVAEHVAHSIADDLYQPALVFHIMGESQLKAVVPTWPERQVLASTAVQCALARPQSSSIPGRVSFEDDQLVLNIHGCLEEAIEALVCSGHAVLGRRCDLHQTSIAASEKAAKHNGVWILRDDVLEGIWIQASCGAFVDICSPVSLRKVEQPDTAAVVEQHAAAGMLCDGSHGVYKQQLTSFQCSWRPQRIGLHSDEADSGETAAERLIQEATVQAPRQLVWHREATSTATVLRLEGRPGWWVVSGSWWGRVLGREDHDIVKRVGCKSLWHLISTYSEDLGLDEKAAIQGCQAIFGRVEEPGILRILQSLNDPSQAGSLFLDGSSKWLIRAERDILKESWSALDWRVMDGHRGLTTLGISGRLKRKPAGPPTSK